MSTKIRHRGGKKIQLRRLRETAVPADRAYAVWSTRGAFRLPALVPVKDLNLMMLRRFGKRALLVRYGAALQGDGSVQLGPDTAVAAFDDRIPASERHRPGFISPRDDEVVLEAASALGRVRKDLDERFGHAAREEAAGRHAVTMSPLVPEIVFGWVDPLPMHTTPALMASARDRFRTEHPMPHQLRQLWEEITTARRFPDGRTLFLYPGKYVAPRMDQAYEFHPELMTPPPAAEDEYWFESDGRMYPRLHSLREVFADCSRLAGVGYPNPAAGVLRSVSLLHGLREELAEDPARREALRRSFEDLLPTDRLDLAEIMAAKLPTGRPFTLNDRLEALLNPHLPATASEEPRPFVCGVSRLAIDRAGWEIDLEAAPECVGRLVDAEPRPV